MFLNPYWMIIQKYIKYGIHLGFLIESKKKPIVKDHQQNMPGRCPQKQFGGFRRKKCEMLKNADYDHEDERNVMIVQILYMSITVIS